MAREPKFGIKKLRRLKAEKRKFNSRLKKWKKIIGKGIFKETKLFRLKRSGNPWRLPAKYWGNVQYYRDGDWNFKGPYRYSKDVWKARKLEEEILKFKKKINLEDQF